MDEKYILEGLKGKNKNKIVPDEYYTWSDVKISSPHDRKIVYRIAALAHAGFSWDRIRRLLDGYHPDTDEKHYTYQLSNLDTPAFNSLLSDGNMAMAIREGNDAYEEFKNGLENYQRRGAITEYKKWVFKENVRLKKKSEKLLNESAANSVAPAAPPPNDKKKTKWWEVDPDDYADSSEETRKREIIDVSVYGVA